ncbi:MAG: cytochrome-c peroxidase [Planctomycetota bacterium]
MEILPLILAALSPSAPQTPPPPPPAAPAGESQPAAVVELFESRSVLVPTRPGDEEPLEPLPDTEDVADMLDLELLPARIELGKRLFHDTRLSHDFTISCASCHDLRFGGIDRTRRAVGIYRQPGPINTPTVFNSALQVSQFWDGRAEELAEQAAGPPQAKGEMGSNFGEILARLREDRAYERAFRNAYPDDVEDKDDINRERLLEAIATYEATLMTPDAPFDRWLRGDSKAISANARRGYALFVEVGCSECHYGPGVGGKAFQKMGRKIDYFQEGHMTQVDHGRFNVTKDARDQHVFKVPMLRNVEVTPPYLHNGQAATLREAVRLMAYHQLGYRLKPRDTDDIVAFLESLTGTFEGRSLRSATSTAEKTPR